MAISVVFVAMGARVQRTPSVLNAMQVFIVTVMNDFVPFRGQLPFSPPARIRFQNENDFVGSCGVPN